MKRSTAGEPSIGMAALFAYAAGATGILANLSLVAFNALQANRPEDGFSLGTAKDMVGAPLSAFMIPVALAVAGRLPLRRAARLTQAAGLTAMALLTVGGPLLVFGLLAFDVQVRRN